MSNNPDWKFLKLAVRVPQWYPTILYAILLFGFWFLPQFIFWLLFKGFQSVYQWFEYVGSEYLIVPFNIFDKSFDKKYGSDARSRLIAEKYEREDEEGMSS